MALVVKNLTLARRTPWIGRHLVGYGPWGHKELDTTKVTWHTCTHDECDYPDSWHFVLPPGLLCF